MKTLHTLTPPKPTMMWVTDALVCPHCNDERVNEDGEEWYPDRDDHHGCARIWLGQERRGNAVGFCECETCYDNDNIHYMVGSDLVEVQHTYLCRPCLNGEHPTPPEYQAT